MQIVITLLDLLFLTWFFWLSVPVASLGMLIAVFTVNDNDDPPFYPPILLAFVALGIAWHCPWLKDGIFNWHYWVIGFAAYYVIGFVVCMYKWLGVLTDFRGGQFTTIEPIIVRVIKDVKEDQRVSVPSRDTVTQDRLESSFPKCIVAVGDDEVSIRPNWNSYPVSNWWNYWPAYAFSIIVDPIRRLIKASLKALRHFFDWMARRFSVEVKF
jgi:hypothetical protein